MTEKFTGDSAQTVESIVISAEDPKASACNVCHSIHRACPHLKFHRENMCGLPPGVLAPSVGILRVRETAQEWTTEEMLEEIKELESWYRLLDLLREPPISEEDTIELPESELRRLLIGLFSDEAANTFSDFVKLVKRIIDVAQGLNVDEILYKQESQGMTRGTQPAQVITRQDMVELHRGLQQLWSPQLQALKVTRDFDRSKAVKGVIEYRFPDANVRAVVRVALTTTLRAPYKIAINPIDLMEKMPEGVLTLKKRIEELLLKEFGIDSKKS